MWTNDLDRNLDQELGRIMWTNYWDQWTKNESKIVEQKFWSIGGRFLPVGIAVFRIGGMTIFGSSTLGWAYIGFGEISSG